MSNIYYAPYFDNGEPYDLNYNFIQPYIFKNKEDCIEWIEAQFITLRHGTKQYHYKYDEVWENWTVDLPERAKEIHQNEDNINSFYEIEHFILLEKNSTESKCNRLREMIDEIQSKLTPNEYIELIHSIQNIKDDIVDSK